MLKSLSTGEPNGNVGTVPDAGDNPPKPKLTLNVGITGHRASILPPSLLQALEPVVTELFVQLRDALHRVHAAEPAIFDATPPLVRLHTPLASGADQLAATSARSAGYHVRALLPFDPEEYSNDFAEGRELEEFRNQLRDADEFFALPGERIDGDSGYVMVGKAVVAASDILVAIWDGGEGKGPGGTAHVIELALAANVPTIHVAIDPASAKVEDVRLLVGGDLLAPVSEALTAAASFEALVRDTLTPHTAGEREQIAMFYCEQESTTNLRIEYPLLLSLLGVKPLPAKPWRHTAVAQEMARDWAGERRLDEEGARVPLARAYGWANFLAIRYAQLFRSGHIVNYTLSACAVLLALMGIIFPTAKVLLVLLELATIGMLFRNTNAGTKGEWHRKWLQYRYLAESLRPLIYLKRTGMISPPFRSDFVQGPLHREAGADWTRWYAGAIWREMASPKGVMTAAAVRQLAREVQREQIIPQASYHRANAHRMHTLDHRLHEIGNFLIGAVIAACVLFLVGYFLFPVWTASLTGPFIVLTAGLPAVGAAVFGMRGHGEHLIAASRSASTVAALEANAARLSNASDLEKLAHELERTAAIMLADLNEWTAVYRERSLEIPA